ALFRSPRFCRRISRPVLSDPNHLCTVFAVLCYGAATLMLLRDVDRRAGRPAGRTGLLLVLGAASHALTLIAALFGGPYVNLELGTALSTAAWVVMILFLAEIGRASCRERG